MSTKTAAGPDLTLKEACALIIAARFEWRRYKDLVRSDWSDDQETLDKAFWKLTSLIWVLSHPEDVEGSKEETYTLTDREMRMVVVAAELELEHHAPVPACRRTPDMLALRSGHDKLCEAVHRADPKRCYYPESRGA